MNTQADRPIATFLDTREGITLVWDHDQYEYRGATDLERRLRVAMQRIYRDRGERDKVLAEILTVMPEMGGTVSDASERGSQ